MDFKAFYEGMADVLETELSRISQDFDLHTGEAPWDSLAIVSTIALVDDHFDVMLEGKALIECKTINDIEKLIISAKKSNHA